MQIARTFGAERARHSILSSNVLSMAHRFWPFGRGELPANSPQICRSLAGQTVSPFRNRSYTSSLKTNNLVAVPLTYLATARGLEENIYGNKNFQAAILSTRFFVLEADAQLLKFLDRSNFGFNVFDLNCGGFEFNWRADLRKVFDSRSPVYGRIYIFWNNGAAEVEHLAVPILEGKQLTGIRGWMSSANGKRLPKIDWVSVRNVKRNDPPRTLSLPRHFVTRIVKQTIP